MKRFVTFLLVTLLGMGPLAAVPAVPANTVTLDRFNAGTGKWEPLPLNPSGNVGKVFGVKPDGTWGIIDQTGSGGSYLPLTGGTVTGPIAAPSFIGPPALPTGGLLADYRFDEGSGTTLTDYSGNGNNGTYVGSPTFLAEGGIQPAAGKYAAGTTAFLATARTIYLASDVPPSDYTLTATPIIMGSSTGLTNLNVQRTEPTSGYRWQGAHLVANGGATYSRAWSVAPSSVYVTAVTIDAAGGASKVYINGQEVTYSETAAFGIYRGGIPWFGQSATTPVSWPDSPIRYAASYSTLDNAATIGAKTSIIREILRRRGTVLDRTVSPTDTSSQLLCVGDSITLGAEGVPSYAYSLSTTETFQSPAPIVKGWAGAKMLQLVDSTKGFAAVYYAPAAGINVAVVFAGTNDALTSSWQQVYAATRAACRSLRAAGWKVIVCTLLDRGDAGYPEVKNTFYVPLETAVRAGWPEFADEISDFAGNANLGALGASSNATNFVQPARIHPATAGKDLMASILSAAINRLTSGLRSAPAFAGALNGNATTATALATPRNIYGNPFDGSAALTQIIASTYGGTGNGFTAFSGPSGSQKTFTLPNANATILTSNTAVTIAQGGTGATTAAGAIDALIAGEVTLASSATPNLGGTASPNVQITGTTTITGFTSATAGIYRNVRFAASLTLTHNATSLILPNGGNNITTAAGDNALIQSLGSGNWLVRGYWPASGAALVGGSGGGDASTNTASSVDGEMVLFSGSGGKTLKRSTLTGGLLKSTGGIPAIATAGTDYQAALANAGELVKLGVKGADIASASTINLETATGERIDVTGTTTIGAITLSEGHRRIVRFTGSLTVTNSANIVSYTGADMPVNAGDFATFIGRAGGVVEVISWVRSGGTLASPSVTVGLTAKNGTSNFGMRADAAPALDQTITPTWTGAHTWNANSLGTTTIPLNTFSNTTPAALGAQQISPGLMWTGQGWATTGSASQETSAIAYLLPTQGSAPGSEWTLAFRTNNGAWTSRFTFNSSGTMTSTGGAINAGTSLSCGSTGAVTWGSRGGFRFSADGIANLQNNGLSSGVTLDVATTDGTLNLRNRANSAAGNLNAGTVTVSSGLSMSGTVIAAGTTTSPVTIDKPSGIVRVAAGATSFTVNSSMASANSMVFVNMLSNDSTAVYKCTTVTSGSFTIRLTTAPTSECTFCFQIVNPV